MENIYIAKYEREEAVILKIDEKAAILNEKTKKQDYFDLKGIGIIYEFNRYWNDNTL